MAEHYQVLTGIAVAWMDVKNDYLSLQKPAKLKLPELIGRFHCKVVFSILNFAQIQMASKVKFQLFLELTR